MSGIPTNESLQRFREVETNEQVSLRQDSTDLDRQEKTGSLGQRFVRWITGKGDTENNRATKAFFDALEQAYGKHVTNWAIQGYEDRLWDGKPLSGYRIQQILERAQTARTTDQSTLKNMLDKHVSGLVDKVLSEVEIEGQDGGIKLPDGEAGKNWRSLIEREVKQAIRQSPQFQDPGKLEHRDFTRDFIGVVKNYVETNKQALLNISAFEERRTEILGQIRGGNPPVIEGSNWGRSHSDIVERSFFPQEIGRDYKTMFLRGFGQGEGQVGTVDEYVDQEVMGKAKERFEKFFGAFDPQKLQSYDGFRSGPSHNGSYVVLVQPPRPFFDVHDISTGMDHGHVRDHKFHLSVPPEYMRTAFESLAPILMREDCPIKVWKLVDHEQAKLAYDQTNDLEAKRLYEECQFTLYIREGQNGEEFRDILREIEEALTTAGIPSGDTPGSDVPVGRFVSFRIDTLTLNPGDPGYGVARERSGVEDGQPVEIRLEPNDPNYETYKAKFVESPYYQAQVGLVVETFEEQVAGLRGDLEKIQIGQRDDFMMQIGRAAQLHQTIVAAGLPESDTTRFQGTYNDIMNTTILRQLGLEGDRVPEQLMGLVDLIPTMCQLGVEFAKPGPVDPRLLGKLQLSIAAFEEIKRTLGQQDGLQGAVKDTIEFFERELSDMSKMGREGQNPVLRHISDVTAGHIQDPRVKDGGREWINDLEALPFLTEDQEAKAKAALILAQAGKIILRMDQPDLPIDVRLRMAGELDSLSSEFQTTIRGWSGRLEEDDVAGREALNRLQRLSLTPDLGDLKGIFRQINGTEIPDEPGNIDEAFRELGRNLEMMDRGLPLLDDEVSELKEQLEYLEGFGKDYIPAPGLRTQFQRLMGEVKRLRDFVGE